MKAEEVRDIQIKLLVNENEQEQIRNNAEACGRTVSAYVRESALNMCILNIDQTYLAEHTQKITSLRNAIFDLTFTIRMSGSYCPPDLEYIYDKMDEISELEKEFVKSYRLIYSKMKNMVTKRVRQNIDDRIKKCETL